MKNFCGNPDLTQKILQMSHDCLLWPNSPSKTAQGHIVGFFGRLVDKE
jgi:hypothetical protein